MAAVFFFFNSIHLGCVYVDNTRCHFSYCLDLTFMEKQILPFYQIIFRDVWLETINTHPTVNVAQLHLLHVFCYLKGLKRWTFLHYKKFFLNKSWVRKTQVFHLGVLRLFPERLNLFKITQISTDQHPFLQRVECDVKIYLRMMNVSQAGAGSLVPGYNYNVKIINKKNTQ